MLDRRVGDDAFGEYFGYAVVVVGRHANRIACTSPMQRFAAIAHLCNAADIHNFGLFVFGLCEYGVANIFSSGYVCFVGGFWAIVGSRRNHASYMQNDICACYAAQHVLITG